ncbi:TerD family protein [Streptomyces ortus]|uniref:TerD family protein n=2 Tax=Bacillati TaxID=1783272 RepID=A0ABT3UWA3_9ACTN|nr:TerD family protein [Streptomyces ortus]MCX4231845.1 TerD family protein [Streptomyces ortus]
MTGTGRRTRPWGDLKGSSAEDNAVAKVLRGWLDHAGGMGVDEVWRLLTPEQFEKGRVPSRTTVASRLAGVALTQDFVEAIAFICSRNEAHREQLLKDAHAARRQAREHNNPQPTAGAAFEAAQLVLVQQRSIDVSDKLLRAQERMMQLERERNDANQMVLILLAMAEKLQRDIATLGRQRDRMHGDDLVHEELRKVRAQLTHSEEQRDTAEADLERARAERQRADELAEEAAAQVRLLTVELEQLRGQAPAASEDTEVAPMVPDPSEALSGTDDIDAALRKARRHLDDRADRLDQLANELHLDNLSDNSPTSGGTSDNLTDNALAPAAEDSTLTPEEVFFNVQSLVGSGEVQTGAQSLLCRAGRALSVTQALQTAAMLHDADLPIQATQLIFEAAANTPADEMPELVSGLHVQKRGAELYQVLNQLARSQSAAAIVDTVTCLREADQHSDAYQVLSAVGRDCPPAEVLKVLTRVDERDTQWILDAACRDRPLYELPQLAEKLRNLRPDDVKTIQRVHRQREEAEARETSHASDSRPPYELSHESELNEIFHLRPYALAGGETQPRHEVPFGTIVRTTVEMSTLRGQLPEHQLICRLCREPHDIDQIAEILSIPIGVARILVGDLLKSGLLTIQSDSIQLNKGDSIELASEASGGTLIIGVGWEVPANKDWAFNVNASAIATRDRIAHSSEYFIFYKNLRSPENEITHTGMHSGRNGDKQTIVVHLGVLPTEINKVVFPVSIRNAEKEGGNLGSLRNTYIRIATPKGREIARYKFGEDAATNNSLLATDTALLAGELHRYDGKWEFRALGRGYPSGLAGVALDFSVGIDSDG